MVVYRSIGKRAFDLLLASALLLLLSPVTLMAWLLVRLQLGAPVVFRQVRPGLGGRPFELLKFRTMTNDQGLDGTLLPDSARLTRVGRFLRSSSLDELPELWNVIRGDMSLVGPRPLLMQYLDRYTPDQARRHEIRPGLTGWAQVNGRNQTPWDVRFRQDVWYVDHLSFLLDIRILFVTVWRVLARQGISAPGEDTMPEFKGSGRCV